MSKDFTDLSDQDDSVPLRDTITDVHWYVGADSISFKVAGKPYTGFLRGRNADLVLSGVQEIDASIAVRVLVDGDAEPIND